MGLEKRDDEVALTRVFECPLTARHCAKHATEPYFLLSLNRETVCENDVHFSEEKAETQTEDGR